MSEIPPEVTILLNQAAGGDEKAAAQVYPFVVGELRKVARSVRRRLPAGETLRVTALVNEAYLRMAGAEPEGWKARSHFFFAASRAMRDILVEQARRKSSRKRGGGRAHVDVDEIDIPLEVPVDILALNAAMDRLEQADPEGHRIAMLRYFAGLSVPEVAQTLETSVSTVERKWRFLRIWFVNQLA